MLRVHHLEVIIILSFYLGITGTLQALVNGYISFHFLIISFEAIFLEKILTEVLSPHNPYMRSLPR